MIRIVLDGVRVKYCDVPGNDCINIRQELVLPIAYFRRYYVLPKEKINKEGIRDIISSLEVNEPVYITRVAIADKPFAMFYCEAIPKDKYFYNFKELNRKVHEKYGK